MKKTVLIVILSAACTLLKAQTLQKGDNLLSAAIGMGDVTSAFNVSTPGISLRYEHILWDAGEKGVLSLTCFAGRKSYSSLSGYTYYNLQSKINLTALGGGCTYHFTDIENEKWDVYAGAMFTLNILSWKLTDSNGFTSASTTGLIGFPIFGGGRYFFTPHFAVFAELGFGLTNIAAGVTYKF